MGRVINSRRIVSSLREHTVAVIHNGGIDEESEIGQTVAPLVISRDTGYSPVCWVEVKTYKTTLAMMPPRLVDPRAPVSVSRTAWRTSRIKITSHTVVWITLKMRNVRGLSLSRLNLMTAITSRRKTMNKTTR